MGLLRRGIIEAGHGIETLGRSVRGLAGRRRIWIDVGAHLGESTFRPASDDPYLTVYAFEPILSLAAQTMGRLPNFVMLPMAVHETEGMRAFYVNAMDATSSLLPCDEEGRARWKGGEFYRTVRTLQVPVIRLDTFMNEAGIPEVDYLKIDAQGADLSVVRSAGARLRDIRRIMLEVAITPLLPYQGAEGKEATVRFLQAQGFDLLQAQRQSHDQEENLTFERRASRGDRT